MNKNKTKLLISKNGLKILIKIKVNNKSITNYIQFHKLKIPLIISLQFKKYY